LRSTASASYYRPSYSPNRRRAERFFAGFTSSAGPAQRVQAARATTLPPFPPRTTRRRHRCLILRPGHACHPPPALPRLKCARHHDLPPPLFLRIERCSEVNLGAPPSYLPRYSHLQPTLHLRPRSTLTSSLSSHAPVSVSGSDYFVCRKRGELCSEVLVGN